MNGSLSYHMSFCLKYEHTPADFYFISLLQKLLAPKEFAVTPARRRRGKAARTAAITVNDEATGIFPLDKVLVRPLGEATGAAQASRRSGTTSAARFDAHAKDLFAAFDIKIKDERGRTTAEFFRTLVVSDPFIEVPDLKMPRARVVFLFDDKTFFRYLLPLPADDGRRQSRRDFVKDDYYDCFKEWVQHQQEQAKGSGHQTVRLTREYLQEVYEVAPQQLRYLFLSGFIQNIVDFMNQDASEVLDSTDPVYPATPSRRRRASSSATRASARSPSSCRARAA